MHLKNKIIRPYQISHDAISKSIFMQIKSSAWHNLTGLDFMMQNLIYFSEKELLHEIKNHKRNSSKHLEKNNQ